MSILNPDLVWIQNRCYRKLPIKDAIKDTYQEDDLYPTEPNEFYNEEGDEEGENLPITHEGNIFWITIPVPGPLIGLVKGKQSKTIKSIEESTNTSIRFPGYRNDYYGRQDRRVPSKNEISADVVITGAKRISVSDAYKRIEGIITSGRWKMCDYTHFISIPMNNDSITQGFLRFQEDVLKNCKSARGVSADLFEFPTTLHLTISMLTLLNDKEKEVAKGELNKCKNSILKMLNGKALRIEVKGIEYMNDDPGEVDILYAKVREIDDDNSLQIIADQLASSFIDINFARKEYESIKLHVTLMKSRKNEAGGRHSFDARPLLQNYLEYVFGEMTVNEIHISTRYTGNEKRYYVPVASITL